MQTIPPNTATAALRRVPFTLVDATDLATPEDITVTGVKVSLSFAGGTSTNSTNDIVKVNGTVGEYYCELTQAESDQAAGTLVRGWLQPTGCALSKLVAQIAPVVAADLVSQDGEPFTRTLQAGTVNLLTLATTEPAIDDHFNDHEIYLPDTAQWALVTDYVGASRQATVVDRRTGGDLASAPGAASYQIQHPVRVFSLRDGIITSAKFTVATLAGVASGILEKIDALWRSVYRKHAKNATSATAGTIDHYADDGTTVIASQPYTVSGDTQTIDDAS